VSFQPPPPTPGNESPAALFRHAQQTASAVRLAMAGKLNATGSITLTANAATTALNDSRLTVDSVVLFDPTTANAAAELAAGTLYVLTANRNNLAWTLTHANAASADRTFRYVILG